jgi:hypothetical protein
MRTITLLSAAFLFCFTTLLGAEEPVRAPAAGDPVEDIGTFIEAGNGLRLQILLQDKQIVAWFVNAEDQIVESPAESILFIVDDTTHRDDKWQTVLKPAGKVKLTSPKRFYGPPDFRAKIIIRFTDGEASTFPKTPLELERNL